jgi:hypothetical protein
MPSASAMRCPAARPTPLKTGRPPSGWSSAVPYARDAITRFSSGVETVPPGLWEVAAWHAKPGPGRLTGVLFLGGIGRKR